MKIQLAVLALLLGSTALPAAADEIPTETIAACQTAANAKKLKGEAFNKAVGDCIAKARPANAAVTPAAVPQEKKQKCAAAANAKKLKGADREAFMKQCFESGVTTGDSPAAVPAEVKAACDAEANQRKLKGAERSSFVAECEKR